MERILITGATGNVGFATLKTLLDLQDPNFELIAAVRDVERAKAELSAVNCQFVSFEYDEPSSYANALAGVTKILLIRPIQVSDVSKHIFPFLDKAKEVGVKHIVFLSVIGADKNRLFPHHRIEKKIAQLDVDYTNVRACFFMQNLASIHRQEILEHDQIYIPAGIGKVNYVDVRDVADIMSHLLLNAGHERKTYQVTGGEVFDYPEIADIFSQELGRTIRYARPSTLQFIRQKLREKKPLAFVKVMSKLYKAARSSKMEVISADLEAILGKPPRKLVDFVHDYRKSWIK